MDKHIFTAIIKDNGQGINMEEGEVIYDLFSTAAVKHKTPGLGLYMVSQILKKLFGNITHQSYSNTTEFKFTIPISQSN